MVKLADDKYVLMFRAMVGDKSGLYVLNAKSPTSFRLPEQPPTAVMDAARLDCVPSPDDYLALPHMIKLTEKSRVDDIPGTRGAFVAFFEVRRMQGDISKWHVFGAYSTDPLGLTHWIAMRGGARSCRRWSVRDRLGCLGWRIRRSWRWGRTSLCSASTPTVATCRNIEIFRTGVCGLATATTARGFGRRISMR